MLSAGNQQNVPLNKEMMETQRGSQRGPVNFKNADMLAAIDKRKAALDSKMSHTAVSEISTAGRILGKKQSLKNQELIDGYEPTGQMGLKDQMEPSQGVALLEKVGSIKSIHEEKD